MLSRLWVGALVLCGAVANAQTVTSDAVKVAEIISVQGWRAIEQGLPAIVMQLEANLKNSGATTLAAATFSQDFQKAMTQEAVARIYAQVVAQRMSTEEQQATLAFLQSAAGAKFLAIGGSGGQDVQAIAVPLARELCASIKSKISQADAHSLAVCR